MRPEKVAPSDILISPLTFVQAIQSSGALVDALVEQEVNFRAWFGGPALWRKVARHTTVPLYYHLITSGYLASVDNHRASWMFVRGRQQLLYIEALATHPDWQRRGIARSLLRFAVGLAQELSRNWMGVTVTLENRAAVQLCESEGYRRGHWQVMHAANRTNGVKADSSVQLRPIFGPGAEQAYFQFASRDISAGQVWDKEPALRMMSYDLFHQRRHGWVITVGGIPSGYVSQRTSPEQNTLFLACAPECWDSEAVIATVVAHTAGGHATSTTIRLGSTGHHEAARAAFATVGFEEQPAETTFMFRPVNPGPVLPNTPSGG